MRLLSFSHPQLLLLFFGLIAITSVDARHLKRSRQYLMQPSPAAAGIGTGIRALLGAPSAFLGGVRGAGAATSTSTPPPAAFTVPRVSITETDRQAATRTGLGNGMQDLKNMKKNDPFSRLGAEGTDYVPDSSVILTRNVVQKLRLQIVKNPKLLEDTSGVIVFDLPKEGSENAKEAKQMKRGLEDMKKGKDTPCAVKAVVAEDEVAANSIVEMLRTMTLQERVAFDAEQAGAMESEGTKLKGELDEILERQKKTLEFKAKQKEEKAKFAKGEGGEEEEKAEGEGGEKEEKAKGEEREEGAEEEEKGKGKH